MAVSSPDTQRVVAYQQAPGPGGNGVIRRFRNPAQFDVLSGRGGNVNKHFGNIYFREIVKGRKMEYNRAKKDRKAEICREVMAHVAAKGGTFLVKENESSSSAFWTEQADDRTMAKVSQALREGAPKIRESLGGGGDDARKRHRPASLAPTHRRPLDIDPAVQEITSSSNHSSNNNHKRVRIDYTTGGKHLHSALPSPVTPPLTTATAPPTSFTTSTMPHLELVSSLSPPLSLLPPHPKTLQRSESSISLTGILPDGMNMDDLPFEDFVNPFGPSEQQQQQPFGSSSMLPPPATSSQQQQQRHVPMVQRSHSLCLSDISAHPNYLEDDFINPFDNEDNDGDHRYDVQSILSRQTSDMGGLGSLWRNNDDDDDDADLRQPAAVDQQPTWQEQEDYITTTTTNSSINSFELSSSSMAAVHAPFQSSTALLVP